MIRTIHRAKYVLAEADLLLQNAAVHVSDPGRISRVEPWNSAPPCLDTEVVDWGSAVILPGLVNAHAHLELTDLGGKITTFDGLTGWLAQLIDLRRGWDEARFRASVTRGAELALQSGTTLVGDISASGVSWDALRETRIRRVVFEEVLGLNGQFAEKIVTGLQPRLAADPEDRLALRGVSPHAPYSVSPDLYRATSGIALERDIPLATHVAETLDELEFLQTGTGPIGRFLHGLGALPEGWTPPGRDPLSFLDEVGALGTAPLLAHCNYVDEAAISGILASHASVAFCPRSHEYFGHKDHPVRQLLDAGVNVALGTDSLASNRSLSILDEMRFLYATRKDLKVEEIIRMATLNGAAALRFGGVVGRLRRGYWADLTILELPPDASSRNLCRQILEGAGECMATIVGGVIAWSRNAPTAVPVFRT